MDESATPSAGPERIARILEPGVREIDLQLFYSAAWLDDRYPNGERDKPVRALHALLQQQPDTSGVRERRYTRPEVRSVTGEQPRSAASNPVAWLGERLRDRVERRGPSRVAVAIGLFWTDAQARGAGETIL